MNHIPYPTPSALFDKAFWTVLHCTLAWSLLVQASHGQQAANVPALTYYLEDEPIYTSSDSQKPGLLLEMVRSIQMQLQLTANIKFLDWEQAQALTQREPNSLIFPLTQTEARKPKYQWIAKVFDVPVMFISLEGSPVIDRYEDASKAQLIGVIKGTPQEARLKVMNIYNVYAVSAAELYEGLASGQFNIIYGAKPEALYGWGQRAEDQALRFGETLQILPLWIAANHQSNLIRIDDWRLAIQRLRQSGEFGEIARRYFGLY